MILIADLSCVSSLLVCALFIHTGAQYSAAEYTSANTLIQRVLASAPQDVPLNLAIILLRVFIFAESLARWFLNVSVLSNTTPRYLG